MVRNGRNLHSLRADLLLAPERHPTFGEDARAELEAVLHFHHQRSARLIVHDDADGPSRLRGVFFILRGYRQRHRACPQHSPRGGGLAVEIRPKPAQFAQNLLRIDCRWHTLNRCAIDGRTEPASRPLPPGPRCPARNSETGTYATRNTRGSAPLPANSPPPCPGGCTGSRRRAAHPRAASRRPTATAPRSLPRT